MIATLPIGSGVDATAFDPGLRYTYASNNEATLTVVHEDSPGKFTVVAQAESHNLLPSRRAEGDVSGAAGKASMIARQV